jgi:hypothetical protein
LEGTRHAGDRSWLAKEVLAVAITLQFALPYPPPNREEVETLSVASAYLSQTGTQVASMLPGCPPLNDEAALLAEFSNSLLASALLCEGLLEPNDEHRL